MSDINIITLILYVYNISKNRLLKLSRFSYFRGVCAGSFREGLLTLRQVNSIQICYIQVLFFHVTIFIYIVDIELFTCDYVCNEICTEIAVNRLPLVPPGAEVFR